MVSEELTQGAAPQDPPDNLENIAGPLSTLENALRSGLVPMVAIEAFGAGNKIVLAVERAFSRLTSPEASHTEESDIRDRLLAALAILEDRGTNEFFKRALNCRSYGLEVRDTEFGRECKVTLPAGTSFREAFEVLNNQSRRQNHLVVIDRGMLHRLDAIDEVSSEDRNVRFRLCENTRVLKPQDSRDRMAKDGLISVDIPWLILAAAIYRFEHGWPEDLRAVGESGDPGDLFQGDRVNTPSGMLHSCKDGVFSWLDREQFYGTKVVSAGCIPEP